MKKLIAILLACLLLVSAAQAAEWAEGRSAAQPYSGVPEVDLSKTIGYIMLYPRTKVPAHNFCDVLEIYLPREDVELNEGKLTLYNADNEAVGTFEFSDSKHVQLRKMDDLELENMLWGGGVCIRIRLDRSLKLNEKYYVFMDEGCFTAASGSLKSLHVNNPEAWTPLVDGEYGVSDLYYHEPPVSAATEQPEETEAAEAEIPSGSGDGEEAEATPAPTEAPAAPEAEAQDPGEIVYKLDPEVGDLVTFDLVLGGDATSAVVYSENDSVSIAEPQYTQSCTITGTVTDANLDLGVAFLNSSSNVVGVVTLAAADLSAQSQQEAPEDQDFTTPEPTLAPTPEPTPEPTATPEPVEEAPVEEGEPEEAQPEEQPAEDAEPAEESEDLGEPVEAEPETPVEAPVEEPYVPEEPAEEQPAEEPAEEQPAEVPAAPAASGDVTYEYAFVNDQDGYSLYYVFDIDGGVVRNFSTSSPSVLVGTFAGDLNSGVTINYSNAFQETFKLKNPGDASVGVLVDGNGFETEYKAVDVSAAVAVLSQDGYEDMVL